MSELVSPSVEDPEAIRKALGGRANVIEAPLALGSAQWCYDRLKRSTSKVRVVASFSGKSPSERNREFQKLVDLLKADSLITAAVLTFEWNDTSVTFKNGTVVQFVP